MRSKKAAKRSKKRDSASSKVTQIICDVLQHELAPQRAAAVSASIARSLKDEIDCGCSVVTPEQALAALSEAVGSRGAGARRASPARKRKQAESAEAAPARRRSKAAAAKAPAKKTSTRAKTVSRSRSRGRARADMSSVSQTMSEKKSLYWALFREVRGDEAHEEDAKTISYWARTDSELVEAYRANIQERVGASAKPKATPRARRVKAVARHAVAPEAADAEAIEPGDDTETSLLFSAPAANGDVTPLPRLTPVQRDALLV